MRYRRLPSGQTGESGWRRTLLEVYSHFFMPLALRKIIDGGGKWTFSRDTSFGSFFLAGLSSQRFLWFGPVDRDADEQPEKEGKEQAVAAKQIVHDVFNHDAEGKLRAVSREMG
jgi:hypothetical protein